MLEVKMWLYGYLCWIMGNITNTKKDWLLHLKNKVWNLQWLLQNIKMNCSGLEDGVQMKVGSCSMSNVDPYKTYKTTNKKFL